MKALMWIAGVFLALFLLCACIAGVHVIQDRASSALSHALETCSWPKP